MRYGYEPIFFSISKNYAYAEGNENPYVPANHPSAVWHKKKRNGLLYTWLAATNRQNTSTDNQGHGQATEGPATPIQGICPPTWHVPSDREWNELEQVFAASTTEYTNSAATPFAWESSYNTVENARPSTSPGHGKSMFYPCPPIGSSAITNGDSKTANNGGFHLLLVGNNSGIGSMINSYGAASYFWSSSVSGSGIGLPSWARHFGNSDLVTRLPMRRGAVGSVRCKKN